MVVAQAGRIFVELVLDDKNFQSALNQAKVRMRAFATGVSQLGRHLLALGAAITGPILAAAFQFATYGDQLDKMAKRTGVAVDELFKLDFVTSQFGANLISIQKGLEKLNGELARTNVPAVTIDALSQLGISLEEIKDSPGVKQLQLILDGMEGIGDATRRLGLVRILLGRAGTDLATLVGRQAELNQQVLVFERLGITFGVEQQRKAANLKDAFNELTFAQRSLSFAVAQLVADDLASLLRVLAKVLVEVGALANANRDLIQTVLLIGTLATSIGGLLLAIGLILSPVTVFLGLAGTMVTLFGALPTLIAAAATIIASVLVIAIVSLNDTIQNFLAGAGAAFQEFLLDIGQGVTVETAFQILVAKLLKAWQEMLLEMIDGFATVFDFGLYDGVFRRLTRGVTDQLKRDLQAVEVELSILQSKGEAERKEFELDQRRRQALQDQALRRQRATARGLISRGFSPGVAEAALRGTEVSPVVAAVADQTSRLGEKLNEMISLSMQTNTILKEIEENGGVQFTA